MGDTMRDWYEFAFLAEPPVPERLVPYLLATPATALPLEHKFVPICDGNLEACDVCHCYEGSLLPYCPGFRLALDEQEYVYKHAALFWPPLEEQPDWAQPAPLEPLRYSGAAIEGLAILSGADHETAAAMRDQHNAGHDMTPWVTRRPT